MTKIVKKLSKNVYSKSQMWARVKQIFIDTVQSEDSNMFLKMHRINLKCPRKFIFSKFICNYKNSKFQCDAEAVKLESPEIILHWSGTHQHSDTTNNPIDEKWQR